MPPASLGTTTTRGFAASAMARRRAAPSAPAAARLARSDPRSVPAGAGTHASSRPGRAVVWKRARFPRRAFRRARRVRRGALRGVARFLRRRAFPPRRRERVEASLAPARKRVRRAGRFLDSRVSAGRRVPRHLILRRRRGVRAVVRPGARGVRARVVRVRPSGLPSAGGALLRRARLDASAEDHELPHRRVHGAVPSRRLGVSGERRRARRRPSRAARRARRARPARARVRARDRVLRARCAYERIVDVIYVSTKTKTSTRRLRSRRSTSPAEEPTRRGARRRVRPAFVCHALFAPPLVHLRVFELPALRRGVLALFVQVLERVAYAPVVRPGAHRPPHRRRRVVAIRLRRRRRDGVGALAQHVADAVLDVRGHDAQQ